MTYETVYNNIYDAIITILTNLNLFDEVEKGPFADIDKFPSAYVHPGAIDIEPSELQHDTHYMSFVVLIAVQGKDEQDTLSQAISYFSAVYDTFYSNRSLNNTAEDVQVRRIEPYSGMFEGFYQQGVELLLLVRKRY